MVYYNDFFQWLLQKYIHEKEINEVIGYAAASVADNESFYTHGNKFSDIVIEASLEHTSGLDSKEIHRLHPKI
jgi:hypothetical protein